MRAYPAVGSEAFDKVDFGDYAEEKAKIIALNSILQKYSLPESIVVHRFAHIPDIIKMSKACFLHKGVQFSDKAFVSTTLVKNLLVSFGKENGCSCVLRIYLPKGLPGAYVSFKTDKTLLNEQEFLLPPNVSIKIIKILQSERSACKWFQLYACGQFHSCMQKVLSGTEKANCRTAP